MKRISSFILFFALFLLTACVSPIFSASQVVTTNANSGAGSLRQAISDIESSGSDGDTITFNLSSGNETITLSSQISLIWQKNFTIDGDNTAGSGVNITVQVTTPGSSTFRIFEIRPYSGTYLFKNMTLKGGAVSGDTGGTIKIHSGDSTGHFTLENVTIQDSKANYGGCVYAWGTMGTLTITSSTFTNCDATSASPYGGGGLFVRTVAGLVISSSTFSDNTSTYQGGGIYIFDENFTMDKVTVSGNTASDDGGGLYLDGDNALATSTFTNSTVSGNTSGGIGGGIMQYYGKVQYTNATISENTTSSIVGGVYSGYGTTYFTNVTLANNNSTPNAYDGYYAEGGSVLYIKNSILANNGTGNDITNNATVTDAGYNIVETSSGHTFSATGDVTGNQANLNLATTVASNSTLYGTNTLALSTGSIAINAGSSVAHQGISIPTTDQRGLSRVSTTDIGAYEYGASSNTAPVLGHTTDNTLGTSTQANDDTGYITIPYRAQDADGDSVTTTGWQYSDDGGSTWNNLDAGDLTSEDGSKSTAIDWSGTEYTLIWLSKNQLDDTSQNDIRFRFKVNDGDDDSSYGTSANFTVDNAVTPSLSSVTSVPLSTSSTITWTSDEASSSQVEYGLTSSYGTTTSESDTSPRVTSHSVTLPSLNSCRRYYYRVKSKDASTNQAVSSQYSFVTIGCESSAITTGTESTISTSTGGVVQLSHNSSIAKLTIPSSFDTTDAIFQINKLNSSTIPTPPSSKSIADENYFDLSAVDDSNTDISSFDTNITFTVTYGSNVESSFVENTLDVYRYDGGLGSWVDKDCTLDMSANTLTCSLPTFSVYGLFGQQSSSSSSTNTSSQSSSSATHVVCSDNEPASAPDLFQINPTVNDATLYFTPISNSSEFYISYSESENAEEHGVLVPLGRDGVQSYTINYLKNDVGYYFKVRGQNGCMPGKWSNIKYIKNSPQAQSIVNDKNQKISIKSRESLSTDMSKNIKQIKADKYDNNETVKPTKSDSSMIEKILHFFTNAFKRG
jgi:hypothetical protein